MDPRDFHIAIICAVNPEFRAALALFDEEWGDCGKADGDHNTYRTGKIGQHPVVILSTSAIGKVAAASAAARISFSFPNINVCFLVGICGAVPKPKQGSEIFLGDVVISNGIVQLDFGRQVGNKIVPKGTLLDVPGRPCGPVPMFVKVIEQMKERPEFEKSISACMQALHSKAPTTEIEPPEEDEAYLASHRHMHRYPPAACSTCARCRESTGLLPCERSKEQTCEELQCKLGTETRSPPPDRVRAVHIGLFGSCDQVIRSGEYRDAFADSHGILAYEMEALGVWDSIPTIIVKGVCDYADSHKNKSWQNFAACRAAACVKSMIPMWNKTRSDGESSHPVGGYSFSNTNSRIFNQGGNASFSGFFDLKMQ